MRPLVFVILLFTIHVNALDSITAAAATSVDTGKEVSAEEKKLQAKCIRAWDNAIDAANACAGRTKLKSGMMSAPKSCSRFSQCLEDASLKISDECFGFDDHRPYCYAVCVGAGTATAEQAEKVCF